MCQTCYKIKAIRLWNMVGLIIVNREGRFGTIIKGGKINIGDAAEIIEDR